MECEPFPAHVCAKTACPGRQQIEQMSSPEAKEYLKNNAGAAEQLKDLQKRSESLGNVVALFDLLESADNKPDASQEPSVRVIDPNQPN